MRHLDWVGGEPTNISPLMRHSTGWEGIALRGYIILSSGATTYRYRFNERYVYPYRYLVDVVEVDGEERDANDALGFFLCLKRG